MARPDFSLFASASNQGNCSGTICQERPNLSLTQPQGCSSPPPAHAAVLTRQLLALSRRQVLSPESLDLNRAVSGMDKMIRRLVREDIALALVLETRHGGEAFLARPFSPKTLAAKVREVLEGKAEENGRLAHP